LQGLTTNPPFDQPSHSQQLGVRQPSVSIGDNMMCGKTEPVLHYPKRFLPRTLDAGLFQHPLRLGDHLTERRPVC
jgi:hypothetical protein